METVVTPPTWVVLITFLELGCAISAMSLEWSLLPLAQALKKGTLTLGNAKVYHKKKSITLLLYLVAAGTNVPVGEIFWIILWLMAALVSHLTLNHIDAFIRHEGQERRRSTD
jgi:riboflavin transporter FmnP